MCATTNQTTNWQKQMTGWQDSPIIVIFIKTINGYLLVFNGPRFIFYTHIFLLIKNVLGKNHQIHITKKHKNPKN